MQFRIAIFTLGLVALIWGVSIQLTWLWVVGIILMICAIVKSEVAVDVLKSVGDFFD